MIPSIHKDIPIYMGRMSVEIFTAYSDKVQSGYQVQGRIHSLDPLKPIIVGDIKITPIPADHSAYDAFMYLIEAEGKRVMHTGDFRLHGFRGKATPKLIEFTAPFEKTGHTVFACERTRNG